VCVLRPVQIVTGATREGIARLPASADRDPCSRSTHHGFAPRPAWLADFTAPAASFLVPFSERDLFLLHLSLCMTL
jgi:hypothetical protein